jgi:sialate O-acetylesterase
MVIDHSSPSVIVCLGVGEHVTVEFAGQTRTAVADASGRWMVCLDALVMSAEPNTMMVIGKDSKTKISDVLVGEVWLAGGQSNMGYGLGAANNADQVLSKCDDSLLRFLLVKNRTAAEPQTNCVAEWKLADPAAAKNFSAVAYFFAREIRLYQKCPVAILQVTWGGTDIETWISLNGLRANPPMIKTLSHWDSAVKAYQIILAHPEQVTAYEADLKTWQAEVLPVYNAMLDKYYKERDAGKVVGAKPQPPRPEPSNPDPMGMPSPSRRPSTPTVNFNGMIAPIVPYSIRGVIWYQGENNSGRGLEYRELFPCLITDWRGQWNHASDGMQGEFPFLFVQLPCNGPDSTAVADSGWPWLREAQFMTLKVPHTGMAVTIDVGDPNNVHPKDKIDVGQRLALIARKVVYGENLIASGPLYHDFKVEANGQVRVNFNDMGGGLMIGQSPWYAPGVKPFPKDRLIGFYLAGADRKWFEADAKIESSSVLLSCPQVRNPVAVRYGWANSPRCNLYNKVGLPAAPFRTDNWPPISGK